MIFGQRRAKKYTKKHLKENDFYSDDEKRSTVLSWVERMFPSGTCSFCFRHIRHGAPWACRACLQRLPYVVAPWCHHCGRPLRNGTAICLFCRQNAPPFVWGMHLGVYEGMLQTELRKLKYENKRRVGETFGFLLGIRVKNHIRLPRHAVVVPVPLHPRRLHDRGFNQAEHIAHTFARVTRRPLIIDALIRHKQTEEQARLPLAERRKNVHDAFKVIHPTRIQSRFVILVDDVYTTGATCCAAATTLLRNGASAVGVACTAVVVSTRDVAGAHQ